AAVVTSEIACCAQTVLNVMSLVVNGNFNQFPTFSSNIPNGNKSLKPSLVERNGRSIGVCIKRTNSPSMYRSSFSHVAYEYEDIQSIK
ncbi:hypothetical protein CEXT_169021, partial [Caerostris extrusa]